MLGDCRNVGRQNAHCCAVLYSSWQRAAAAALDDSRGYPSPRCSPWLAFHSHPRDHVLRICRHRSRGSRLTADCRSAAEQEPTHNKIMRSSQRERRFGDTIEFYSCLPVWQQDGSHPIPRSQNGGSSGCARSGQRSTGNSVIHTDDFAIQNRSVGLQFAPNSAT